MLIKSKHALFVSLLCLFRQCPLAQMLLLVLRNVQAYRSASHLGQVFDHAESGRVSGDKWLQTVSKTATSLLGWGDGDIHSLIRLFIHKKSQNVAKVWFVSTLQLTPQKTHFNLEITFKRSLLKISVPYAIHIANNLFEIYFNGHSKVIFIPKFVFRT